LLIINWFLTDYHFLMALDYYVGIQFIHGDKYKHTIEIVQQTRKDFIKTTVIITAFIAQPEVCFLANYFVAIRYKITTTRFWAKILQTFGQIKNNRNTMLKQL